MEAKKHRVIFLLCALTVLLCACGNNARTFNKTTEFVATEDAADSETTQTTKTDETTTEHTVATTEEVVIYPDTGMPTTEIQEEDYIDEPDSTVDIDLTALNKNMVYATVNNMVLNPDEYLGKSIKAKGPYKPLFYDVTGNYYHYILIEDALACCQSGLEFIWDEGKHVYPDEYPAEDKMIEIVGHLACYEEEDYTYYYIATDEIKLCEE